MNDETLRDLITMQMFLLAGNFIAIGSVGFIVIQNKIGRYGPLLSTMQMLAVIVLGFGVYTMGVAIMESGYCRAFWQLLGFDLSPDKDGESA